MSRIGLLAVVTLLAFAVVPAVANSYIYVGHGFDGNVIADRWDLDGNRFDPSLEWLTAPRRGSVLSPTGLAVDGHHVYWSRSGLGGGMIGRANLDGSGANSSFIKGLSGAAAIAIDGLHIYWANDQTSLIGRANLDGSGVVQDFVQPPCPPVCPLPGASAPTTRDRVRDFGIDAPHGVAIDGQHIEGSGIDQHFMVPADPFINAPQGVAVDGQHVYWTNSGNGGNTTIGRANLDGTGEDNSFITGPNEAIGVAVDAQHVYWSDQGTHTIGRANIDGTGVNDAFIRGISKPAGIAVYGGYVYWADSHQEVIGRAKVDGTGVVRSLVPAHRNDPEAVAVDGFGPPGSVAVKRIQPQAGGKIRIAVRVKARGSFNMFAGGFIALPGDAPDVQLRSQTIRVAAASSRTLELRPKRPADERLLVRQIKRGRLGAHVSATLPDGLGRESLWDFDLFLTR
jgi:hypothetical protein